VVNPQAKPQANPKAKHLAKQRQQFLPRTVLPAPLINPVMYWFWVVARAVTQRPFVLPTWA